MSLIPTTPGSIILEDEPKFYPEDSSRYMGSVWQLQNDGMWLRLTDDGTPGARTWPTHFDSGFRVLYEAKADPKPVEHLRRATADLKDAEKALRIRQDAYEGLRREVENLRKACEDATHA